MNGHKNVYRIVRMLKKSLFFLCFSMVFANSVFAGPLNLGTIISSVDFTSVIAGVLMVASVIASVLIVSKGAKMVLCLISNGSPEPISKELYAFEKYVRGEYIPRYEYDAIMSRNPSLSGGRQSRDYAKKMVKSGQW